MGATTPQQWWEIWAKSFDSGDVETILSLYHPEATVVPNPGNPITGVDALRETLQAFVDMHGTMKAQQGEIVRGPGVATVVLADRPDGWVALVDDFYGRG